MKSFCWRRSTLCLILVLFATLLLIPGAYARENYYPDPSTALRTGEPDGIGPLAAISVHDYPKGRAFVYGGESPDLFLVAGDLTNLSPGIYLYKYMGRKEGVPVLDEPVHVQLPPGFSGSCVIFQAEEGDVFGIWKVREDFKPARYNKEEHCFESVFKDQIKEPCDQIWAKNGSGQMTRVEFDNHAPGFIAGHRQGNVSFCNIGPGFQPSDRRYAVDTEGVMLRNKTTNAAALSYPNANGDNCDLIVIGEGGTYYYRFTGRFDDRDQPIYADQAPLLEKNAPVWHSSLPVINTVDFDSDGDIDIISGDSVGFVSLLENAGSTAQPRFLAPVKLRAGGEIIRVRPGYYGSLQGPGEANWGYSCPTVVDWNGDGLADIILSGSTATHKVYMNIGSAGTPKLAAGRELFCEGLDLHGPWRVKPAAGLLNGKMAYILIDDDQQFHLYWKYDDQNLTDGGKLHLENGEFIDAQPKNRTGGRGGRAKITLFDWDREGRNDMLITTHSGNSIPHHKHGIPHGAGAMVLLMLNVTKAQDIRFAPPRPLQYNGRTLYLGEHSCTAAPYPFGKDKYGMVVAIENGRFFLLRPEEVSWGPPPDSSR
ncbi:MAG: FG-GAP repeat domain-containing protein [Planctomycetota bacterium]